jgi:rhamnosyl/mannosyltransferase
MRILQVGKYPKERCGGVETAVYGLSEELAKAHDVEVLVCGPRARLETRGRVTEDVAPIWATVFSTPLAPGLLARLRGARGFDVVQVSLQNPLAVLAYLLTRPPGKLVVWYHHDIVRQKRLGPLFAPIQAAFLRRADAIVATSRAYADSSAALRPFQDKVTVIPLGVPSEHASQESLTSGRRLRDRFGGPLIVFVGRLVYYKGLPVLLEAMVGLDAKLVIVGTGPMDAELRAQAARLGLSDRVFFEFVPYEESVTAYFLAADAVVLPSTERTEAFGLSLLEAMACGKPVVATELGTGTSVVCEDGVNGIVVPPGDSAALRSALKRLLEDPALARRFGEAGREKVRTHYSVEAMTRSFVELYQRLLDAPC